MASSSAVTRVTASTEAAEARGGEGAASAAYGRMRPERDLALNRARRMAEVTVPFVFPLEGQTGADDTQVPWNTLGAYLVFTNLAPKLTSGLFPEGVAPVLLSASHQAEADLMRIADTDQREEMRSGIEAGLVHTQREFADAMDEDGDRSHLAVGSLKLIIGGNHGYKVNPDGTLRGISLERYVVRRDPSGNLLEFCIEDPLAFDTLPEELREKVRATGYNPEITTPKNTILVYTWGVLRAGKWRIVQEVYGIMVEESRATYIPEALPYFFPPFILLPGEDYGRSYVEMFEGDLQSVEGGTQTIQEAAAALARFLLFVHPGGLTSKKAVAEAPNGAVLTGRADDVTTPDWRAAAGHLQSQQWAMEQAMGRLQRAFLVREKRQGERVTAEEIRADIEELQEGLGPIYSGLVISLQAPYVRLKMAALQRSGRMTKLPKHTVKVTILGGLAALGRSAMLRALDNLIVGIREAFGPEGLMQALGPNALRTYTKRRAAALGVSTDGLIPTEAQAEQMDQEQQAMALIEKLGPEAIKQLGNNLTATEVADTNASAKIATAPQQPAPAAPQQ